MKLLSNLLASAVCVVVLTATTVAEAPAQAQLANTGGHKGPFRGPESQHLFNKAESFPGPEDSEDVNAYDAGDLDDQREEELVKYEEELVEYEQELVEYEDELLELEEELLELEEKLKRPTRHLRSFVDPPRPDEPVARPASPKEDPELPTDPVQPDVPEDNPNLRSPGQEEPL
ncbi:unnamed protein product [Phytophthora fragariaefolia]|uniref:Unnamed protein product n=1 Tax=Phytophthora fragariaefolia TaxID=1490495 RepID=A0A9W6XFS1_9STRA|nr:unnamed protein product [Phytophthora fragariaefolia]